MHSNVKICLVKTLTAQISKKSKKGIDFCG